MIKEISTKIVNFLLCKEIIVSEDVEIYQFGIEQVLTTLINILTTIILGVLFGKVFQAVMFLVAFMILRSYSGGFHASTTIGCYILSAISILAALSVLSFFNIEKFNCIELMLLSGVMVFLLSPVDTFNKPLDDIEHIIYKKRAVVVWIIETFVSILFILFNFNELAVCIMLAQVLVDLALVSGRLLNQRN